MKKTFSIRSEWQQIDEMLESIGIHENERNQRLLGSYRETKELLNLVSHLFAPINDDEKIMFGIKIGIYTENFIYFNRCMSEMRFGADPSPHDLKLCVDMLQLEDDLYDNAFADFHKIIDIIRDNRTIKERDAMDEGYKPFPIYEKYEEAVRQANEDR